MPIPRHGRRDANEPEIVAFLHAVGADWLPLDVCDGVIGFRGKNYLVEIKNPQTEYGRQGFNPVQSERWAAWRGLAPILLTSVADVAALLGLEATKIDWWTRNTAQSGGWPE